MSTRMPPRPGGQNTRPTRRNQEKTYKKPVSHKRAGDVLLLVLLAVVLVGGIVWLSHWGEAAPADAALSAQPGGATFRPIQGARSDVPIVNEIMPSNRGSIASANGEYYDWIELYNPTQNTINLAGFMLSDNIKNPGKLVLPSYKLESGAYVIIFASGMDKGPEGEIHAPFKLSSSGESVVLSDPDGNEVEQIVFPAVDSNSSYARDPANPSQWLATADASPGFPNTNEGHAQFKQSLVVENPPLLINEVMTQNNLVLADDDGEYSDWVELRNVTDQPINLLGYGLSDDQNDPKRWMFPEITLEADQYILVYLSGKNRVDPQQPLHAPFRLNSYEDNVYLCDSLGRSLDSLTVRELPADASYGRDIATGQWKTFTHPTPGYPNNTDGFNALQPLLYADLGDVIINEVMSSNTSSIPAQDGLYYDWIELYNRSGAAVNLSGWRLSDRSANPGKWKFPDITIGPGEYLTVYASGLDMTDEDAVAKKKLHTNFALKLSGEILALYNADGDMVDRAFLPHLQQNMTYARSADGAGFMFCTQPTPGAPNGSGYLGFSGDVAISLAAGLYDQGQVVELACDDPGAKIYYTLDGSNPGSGSTLYSGPISISKTTILRAATVRDGYLPGRPATASYLIGEEHYLPVLSIVTDPDNLWNEQTGIYTYGSSYTPEFPFKGANFHQDWEKEAHLELFELDGTMGISQGIGLRIFGDYSRGNSLKSFSFYARSRYDQKDMFNYPIFDTRPYTEYKSFAVRTSAQDANRSRIRDVLMTSLVDETTDLEVQAYRSCVVYLNGEFWGVYHMREKVNKYYIEQKFGVDQKDVNILFGNAKVVNGSNEEYKQMLDWVKQNDLSDPAKYAELGEMMEIDNYMDYCISEM